MLKIKLVILSLIAAISAAAEVNYGEWFADSTLRIDFTLSGAPGTPVAVGLAGTAKYAGWGGRRHRLDQVPVAGNAEITLLDAATSDTIYRHTFSTLFQEFYGTEDSLGARSMECAALLPMPLRDATVHISVRDGRGHIVGSESVAFAPSDLACRVFDRQKYSSTEIFRGEKADSAAIHVAIMGEGFAEAEMADFRGYADEAVKAIMNHEPFTSYADHFVFHAIEVPSADSGVSVPRLGQWHDTAFDSHFSSLGSDRYLTSDRVWRMYDAIAATPCTHIIILANTDEYGGGGIYNFYTLTAAGHELMRPVVVHEFGHSFGALADEYFYDEPDFSDLTYDLATEPWEQNITTQVDFDSKWPDMVADGSASLIEGGGYRAKGIWRGAHDCRMRTNTATTFCPVCRRALTRMIEFYTR